jgi:hypothetical protein
MNMSMRNLKGIDSLGDLSIDGKMILKGAINKWDIRVLAGII